MTRPISNWDGQFLGSGPIALIAKTSGCETTAGEVQWLLAKVVDSGGPVVFGPARLGDFLGRHAGEYFVSWDAVDLHRRLGRFLEARGDGAGLTALRALIEDSRWVDLRLLDRQIRFAHGEGELKFRDAVELVPEPEPNLRRETPSEGKSNRMEGDRDELDTVLDVFMRLRAEADKIEADAGPIPPPKFQVADPPPKVVEKSRTKRTRFFDYLRVRHPHCASRHDPKEAPDFDSPTDPQPLSQRLASPAGKPSGFLGNGIEVRGAIALGGQSGPDQGFCVDRRRHPELVSRAYEQYRLASAVISQDQEARECFHWDGSQVRLTRNRHPDFDRDRIANWLQSAARGLCDNQNRPAPIPRRSGGRFSLNPEHWGIWPACHRVLWAWREVFRMAEVMRIQDAGEAVRPRYETLPALRSWEPNLTVYRGLDVPVFHPRPGHVFLAGRVADLRTRCLAVVALRRGYVTRGQARLYNYVLREEDPLGVAASELYAANVNGDFEAHAEAETEFERLCDSDDDRYYIWKWITNALLETAPLGLPGSLLALLLQKEYDLDAMGETKVLQLQALLADSVAYELGPFLADQTVDLVAARVGITANEATQRFELPMHPDTSGAALRNRILKGRARGSLSRAQQPDEDSHDQYPSLVSPLDRKKLIEYRGVSLGGRPTFQASPPIVRQQEVLMALDDVMLEIAYDLHIADHQLLGVAGNEFVIEVREEVASTSQATVEEIASRAAGRILSGMPSPVVVNVTEDW